MFESRMENLYATIGCGHRARRGNTMVLVVGILVLLVIIATGYLTRTHAGRVTAVSQQQASLRDDNAGATAQFLANEISLALFPRPINDDPTAGDPQVQLGAAADSSFPRLTPLRNPVRYGIDQGYPYNFAPYQVVPYTNWPDKRLAGGAPDTLWPDGPGNPGGGTLGGPALAAEANQLGNPGFGDTRWLADNEPLRRTVNAGLDGILGTPDDVIVFSHWRHMTNIARPENGWRVCRDISDITNVLGFPGQDGLVRDLGVPVEQFLTTPSDAVSPSGLPQMPEASMPPLVPLVNRWRLWFDYNTYRTSYVDPTLVPPNFLDLRDLDGDGVFHNWFIGGITQDRPEAEFNRGTARHTVGRFLADADGDGFTDSFWFLSPAVLDRGLRQVVAVRIIDNGGMLNANVATRFAPNDDAIGVQIPLGLRTKGTTPADLALAGRLAQGGPGGPNEWNVGFYDNFDHWFDYIRYDSLGGVIVPGDLWERHVREVNLLPLQIPPFAHTMPDQLLRLDYWQGAGLPGIGRAPGSLYTPFGIPEEIELRMFHGNNYPWVYSRFENTAQLSLSSSSSGFLHGGVGQVESSELRDQLGNELLLHEPRHRLTLYNGTRNDLMPPWLWSSFFPADWDLSGTVDDMERHQYFADMRKLDLRRPTTTLLGAPIFDVDADGLEGADETNPFVDDDIDNDGGLPDKVDHLCHLRNRIERALISDFNAPQAYFEDDGGDAFLERSLKAAAAFAANIEAYRSPEMELNVDQAVPVSNDPTTRFLGMERQPFLVEAAIAHVYEGVQATEQNHPDGPGSPQVSQGDYVVCGDPLHQETLMVVQIANPFGGPVDLGEYEIDVFGQTLDMQALAQNMQLGPGEKRTYLSLPGGGVIDQAGWRGVLDLNGVPATELIDVTGLLATNRGAYDSASADNAIELWRVVNPITNARVLVDRIDIRPGLPDEPDDEIVGQLFDCDYRKFGRVVTELPTSAVEDELWDINSSCTEPANDTPWPGVLNIGSFTHWAQWVTASRPWDLDFNGVPGIQPEEESPRYVFALAKVRMNGRLGRAFDAASPSTDWFLPLTSIADFSSKMKDLDCTDVTGRLHFAMQMLQKDADFEQVGELLNVWMFGHEIETDALGNYLRTTSTFSEWMWEEMFDQPNVTPTRRLNDPNLDGPAVNRLRVRPALEEDGDEIGGIVGAATPLYPWHEVPNLPAGLRLLDGFVCDGYGFGPVDIDGDGTVSFTEAQAQRFGNAHYFTGRMTPGLININTASPEVMQALPHWARLVHENLALVGTRPRSRLAEAVPRYRDRMKNPPYEPDYETRDDLIDTSFAGGDDGLRFDRGFASIGEIMLLNKEPTLVANPALRKPWRADYAANDPFAFASGEGALISTDVINDAGPTPDGVAGDVEEANLLFAGASNLITTRSDVFTVYFKVRSFRQNPASGVWDATDPEFIVDESRYVMCVDRSEVNHPNDKPKIVFLEKVPN